MSGKVAVPKAKKNPAVPKATAKQAPAAAPAKTSAAKPEPFKRAAGATGPAPLPEKKAKKVKKAASKLKVVRDSFTMPKDDYEKIAELKQLFLNSGMHVKKSELLRAGLHALSKLSIAQLKLSISALEKIKTGRPTAN